MTREEAIENIKKALPLSKTLEESFYTLHPELAESEDEKIREWIIEEFKIHYDFESESLNPMVEKALTWLKKQKEQKQEWSEEDEKRVKQLIYDTEHIRAEYEVRKKELGESFNDELIKDCDEQIAWLKSLTLNLKKKNEDVAKLCSNEWSEEDEVYLQDALWCVKQASKVARGENDMGACWSAERWLKSLRPQPQQNMSIGFMLYLDEHRPDGKMCLSNAECNEIETAFKNQSWDTILRYAEKYRPHWKPSEEQMEALRRMKAAIAGEGEIYKPLNSLYEQLKKLM